MSVADPDVALEAIKDSLAAKLPKRYVTRSLPLDPANIPDKELEAGTICVVNEGGGQFANWLHREGDLGRLNVGVVAFVKVAETAAPADVERAELAVLLDLLNWTNDQGDVRAASMVLPIDFTQSKQLEHPLGWLVLRLEVMP